MPGIFFIKLFQSILVVNLQFNVQSDLIMCIIVCLLIQISLNSLIYQCFSHVLYTKNCEEKNFKKLVFLIRLLNSCSFQNGYGVITLPIVQELVTASVHAYFSNFFNYYANEKTASLLAGDACSVSTTPGTKPYNYGKSIR